MFKPVRHVQWIGLPPIEEDELKAKRKMMKDAPKGVEDQNITEEGADGQVEDPNDPNKAEVKDKKGAKISIDKGSTSKAKTSIISSTPIPLKLDKSKIAINSKKV